MPIMTMPILKSQAQQLSLQWRSLLHRRRARLLIITGAALLALFSATVAISQSSANYDLACRSIIASGGQAGQSKNYAITGALGLPVVVSNDPANPPTYALHSGSFGLRAGYLPTYPNGKSAIAAEEVVAPTNPEQNFIQRLPLLAKAGRILHGGC